LIASAEKGGDGVTLGEKIFMLRKAREMNQEQLAERLGVSRQAVSKWELNEAVPDVTRVVAMSELFGVTTDYLLKDNNGTPSAEEKEGRVDKTVQRDPTSQRILGLTLTVLCSLTIFGMWVVKDDGHIYSWSGDGFLGRHNVTARGLTGYLLSQEEMLFVFLLLVLGVIAGLCMLAGKSFVPLNLFRRLSRGVKNLVGKIRKS